MHIGISMWCLEGSEEYQEVGDRVETTERGHRSLPVPDVFSSEIFASIKKKKSRNDLPSPRKILRCVEVCFCVYVCTCVHVCIRLCVRMS